MHTEYYTTMWRLSILKQPWTLQLTTVTTQWLNLRLIWLKVWRCFRAGRRTRRVWGFHPSDRWRDCLCQPASVTSLLMHGQWMLKRRSWFDHVCTCDLGPHAMILSGRVPRYKSSDVQLLPSSTTKHKIWEQEAATINSMRPVGYSTFTRLLRELLPYVVLKPMTDLCRVCQYNSTAITISSNQPIEQKTMVCSVRMYTSLY